jgi:uncharacterized protein involved in outer membrane biogenesis
VQATLLGVSIAIILALVAALVGPHFVDWSQYRATFETEASRLTGVPVRVAGAIDARILPTPSLVLKGVEAGPGGPDGEKPRLRARELSVEFALGPLLRGKWRASELRLIGPEIRLGLDRDGKLDWPASSADLDPDRLSIERFVIDRGRVVLGDAASGATLVLDSLSFAGEFRSLLGPAKGKGAFDANGASYRYALSAGRLAEDEIKLHVDLNANSRPWTAEADGAIRFASGAPEFDGALKLAQPAGAVDARGVALVPWRATGHAKANAGGVLFDKAEFQYGPDERAVRLTAAASIRLGKSPRYDAVVSGRQLDLDGVLALPEAQRRLPMAAARKLGELFAGSPQLPVPGRIGVGIDSVTLAGSPLRDIRGDLTSDAASWNLETFEFRAPGSTQVRASGRLGFAGQRGFKGRASIEAADPRGLFAWIDARAAPASSQVGLLRASGELTLGSERVAVDGLKAEIDRKTFEGRLAYTFAHLRSPARLEAELKAVELDLDELALRAPAAFAGAMPDMPAEFSLSADIDRAVIGGLSASNIALKLGYDADGLKLDRLQIGDLGGAALKVSGQVHSLLRSPRGSVTVELKAAGLEGVAAVLEKLTPRLPEPARAAMARLAPVNARATLTMADSEAGKTLSRLAVEGAAGAMRLRLGAEATGNPLDLDAVALKLDGTLAADDGAQLIALLGLQRAVNVEKGAGSVRLAVRGPAAGTLDVDAQIEAQGLHARAKGTTRLPGRAGLDLVVTVSATDAAPLWPQAPQGRKLPVTLKTHLTASPDKLNLEEIAGSIEGSPIRGRLGIVMNDVPQVEGRLESEELFVPALLALASGLPSPAVDMGSREPFDLRTFGKLTGRIEFGSVRAGLTPSLKARRLRGFVRLGKDEIAFEHVEGDLAGGRVEAELALRRDGAGLATHGRIALADAEASDLLPGTDKAPVSGRLTLQVEADGAGYSPTTLMGSLRGTGTISIERARLRGLDPKAFEAAVSAADRGVAIDAARVSETVLPALAGGELAIARADGALTIAAGQVRASSIIAHGEGADLTLNGTLDLAGRDLDAGLVLAGPASGGAPGTARPELLVVLQGSVAAPQRTVDVSGLVSWLMLRSLDRETRRMEAVEAGKPDATGSLDPSNQAPALAPPVEIRPTPGANRPAPPARPTGAQPLTRDGVLPQAPQNRSLLDQLLGTQR